MKTNTNFFFNFSLFKSVVILCLFLFTFSDIKSQIPKDVCESNIPSGWRVSNDQTLVLDSTFVKIGNQSIRWDWKQNGNLIITDSALQKIVDNPRSMFTCWLYNPIPLTDSLVFVFEKNGKKQVSFSFGLNFIGWRAGWLFYYRDMQGILKSNPDRLIIKAPSSKKSGFLYFDHLQILVTGDPRSPVPDYQLPYVQKDVLQSANAHWSALYPFSRYQHSQKITKRLFRNITSGLQVIQSRLDSILLSIEKKTKSFEQLLERYNTYKIRNIGNVIIGIPLFTPQQLEIIEGLSVEEKKQWFDIHDIKKFHELLLDIALAYRKENDVIKKNKFSALFIKMLNHLEVQGWAYGSGQGVLHHLGYNFKDFYPACFLMRDVLKENQILERTYRTMFWYSGLGRTRLNATQAPTSNIDVFNTQAPGMLYAVMLEPSDKSKIIALTEFSNWLSYNLYPTYSVEGTLKPDGAVFHHANLYPAYGIGGFSNITPLVYVLSQTKFQIHDKAYASLQKALFMMALYCQYNHWPIGISGRHPNGEGEMDTKSYAYMALAKPNIKDDTSMAAIFLRTTYKKNELELKKYIANKVETSAYDYPQGHWNINYGLLDIHRRKDWLLTIRGHNRYFVANESYPGANVFGRYIAYGHLEILYPSKSFKLNNGFSDKGWDWNHLPGITAPYLPIDSLRARIINADKFSGIEEMLLTDEVFAGGTNWQQKHGLFAMKLHGHDKYNQGAFRAIKSWFMFDSTVICLGSNIKNIDNQFPVHTTVYQESIDSVERNTLQEYETTTKQKFISSRGIEYHFSKNQQIVFSREQRNSRNQKDAVSTNGAIEQLYFNHGVSPTNNQYEYSIRIPSQERKQTTLINKTIDLTPSYIVVNKDSLAHIIKYLPEDITAAAVFEKSIWSFDTLLNAVNNPCLLMYQLQKNNLEISITDPDLRFYEGKEDVPLDENGKRKEVSIYSRKWIANSSKPKAITIELKGYWKLVEASEEVKITFTKNGVTVLTILCKYGNATTIELRK